MSKPQREKWWPRLLLVAGATVLALFIGEVLLRILGLPHIHEPKEETPRFLPTNSREDAALVYVNYPGRITFTYDGNPRGYFGVLDEIHHQVNPAGFRGAAFGAKLPGKRRVVFLGDSFTFGEGVRDDHTYAEITAQALNAEACNLGVGGYNTSQAAKALKTVGLGLEPDAVILGYVPNDAEPPLFMIDPQTGQPLRRNREASIEWEAGPQKAPTSMLYRSRLAQLVWQLSQQQRLGKQTVSYYQSLYAADSEGWRESEEALREIIGLCRERDIPCVVLMFPILVDLSESHPFASIHEQVGRVVRDAGGIFVDLLPAVKGQDARDLRVHPTDQHPNERVHAIVGELLAETLREHE
ncbi:MAG: hypothetical protein ACI8W8_002035 [Rhodothermales bacterium]